MNTKEELVSGLQYALNLMKETANLQNKRTNLQSQYFRLDRLREPWSKRKLLGTSILVGLAAMILTPDIAQRIGISVISGGIANTAVGKVLLVVFEFVYLYCSIPIGILCAISLPKVVNRSIAKKNKIIKASNEEVKQKNQIIENSENEVIQQLRNINKQYAEEILPWYPSDYCYINAAESFLHYVKNFRADNMKEAINIFLDEAHKRKMEQTQQQMLDNQNAMIREQRLNNILTVGNLVMQAGIQNAVNQNTSAVNSMHNTVASRRR